MIDDAADAMRVRALSPAAAKVLIAAWQPFAGLEAQTGNSPELMTVANTEHEESLCNLIANMLDSVNGDLSGDESYRSMRNVCDDLQLMLDSPDIYLKDIDLAKPSLPFDEAIFGRESVFRTLQESYTRSIAGNNELVIISGVFMCLFLPTYPVFHSFVPLF